MTVEQILSIVTSVGTLVGAFIGYYFYVKSTITKAAAEAVKDAEVPDKIGEEKLAQAVEQVYALVPTALKLFISKEYIKKAVQYAFTQIDAYAKKQIEKNK